MIRTVARKATLLAAATLLVGSLAVNCSKKETVSDSDVGSVGLAVQLSPGVNLNTVAYRISGNGITPLTGNIAVSDPGATVAVLISGIPAGTGYLVELTGTSTDGNTMCAGSATFNVVANQSTSVQVLLQCRAAGTTGSVVVTGGINNCPAVTSTVAAPLAVAVGGIITVGSSAADLDAGAVLTYAWTATAGTFASATIPNTTYNCSTAGPQTLTITVSDGTCTASSTVPVTCVALSCGNGVVNAGEQCDPPSAANHCDQNCQIIPVCGNGVREGSEQCDPPNGTTCNAMCVGIPVVCGNGIVQPGESCDPPASGTCSQTCQTVVATCGDGMINQASEQCEPPNTATCSATCQTIVSACQMCETANCDPTLAGCDVFPVGAQRTACLNLLDCIRTSHCANNAFGDSQPCYCGTATDIACLSGTGNGACKAQVEAAAGTTAADVIANSFVDPALPLGRAVNTITCDVESCNTQCPR